MSSRARLQVSGAQTDIVRSWHRCAQYGVLPDQPIGDLPAHDIDTGSSLTAAARPALARLATAVSDAEHLVVLADHNGRIIEQFGRSTAVRDRFAAYSVRAGVDFSEEAVGTNAIGTALELRRPVSIGLQQHYNRALRSVACVGAPIFHPITRRLLGVIDLSGGAHVTEPSVRRMVGDTVAEIESLLLAASSRRQQRLLAAFRVAAPRHQAPVLAVDDEMLLANRAALDLLDDGDLATIKGLIGRGAGDARVCLPLTHGLTSVQIEEVPGTARGLLLVLEPRPTGSGPAAGPDHLVADPHGLGPSRTVLVSGPPGSGRSTYAAQLAGSGTCRTVAFESALDDNPAGWMTDFRAALADPFTDLVCVEEIAALPDGLLVGVAELLRREHRSPVVLTCAPLPELTGRSAALAATCDLRIELPALADRTPELHTLAQRMLRQLAPDAQLRLTPSVLEALGSQPWPGNLTELRMVLAHVCAGRSSGDVLLRDLPEDYRTTGPLKHLGGLARAERQAIMRELRRFGGNKVRAAEALGISRTTLYARMRTLSIQG